MENQLREIVKKTILCSEHIFGAVNLSASNAYVFIYLQLYICYEYFHVSNR